MTVLNEKAREFVTKQVNLQVDYFLSSWENARMDGEDVSFTYPEAIDSIKEECKTSLLVDTATSVGQRNSIMNSLDDNIYSFLISGAIQSHEFSNLVQG